MKGKVSAAPMLLMWIESPSGIAEIMDCDASWRDSRIHGMRQSPPIAFVFAGCDIVDGLSQPSRIRREGKRD